MLRNIAIRVYQMAVSIAFSLSLFILLVLLFFSVKAYAAPTANLGLPQVAFTQQQLTGWPFGMDLMEANFNAAMVLIDAQATAAASIATAQLKPGAATQAKVDYTGIKTLKGIGAASAGAVTLTGAVIGMRVIMVFGNLTAGGPMLVFIAGTDFESAITVTNQVQQLSASNLSADTIVFLLVPATS